MRALISGPHSRADAALKLPERITDNRDMWRARLTILLAGALMSFLVSAPSPVAARPHTVAIVRDGLYAGGDVLHGQALTFFHIKHHQVFHLRLTVTLDCHDSSTGQDYTVPFTAGANMPQGRRIPANGTLTINWIQEDAGRRGHINAELAFHRHFVASFAISSGGGVEVCTGFSAIPVQRGRKPQPVPSTP